MTTRDLALVAAALVAAVTIGTLFLARNHAPQCAAKTIVMKNLPATAELSAIKIDPIAAAPMCTDADHDRLTLVATSPQTAVDAAGQVTLPGSLKAGQSTVIAFTVSDGKGGTATSTLTIKRD